MNGVRASDTRYWLALAAATVLKDPLAPTCARSSNSLNAYDDRPTLDGAAAIEGGLEPHFIHWA